MLAAHCGYVFSLLVVVIVLCSANRAHRVTTATVTVAHSTAPVSEAELPSIANVLVIKRNRPTAAIAPNTANFAWLPKAAGRGWGAR